MQMRIIGAEQPEQQIGEEEGDGVMVKPGRLIRAEMPMILSATCSFARATKGMKKALFSTRIGASSAASRMSAPKPAITAGSERKASTNMTICICET